MELQQVLHTEGLEQQHHVGQVGPLDLGHRGGQELILVGALGIQPAREETRGVLHPSDMLAACAVPGGGPVLSPRTASTDEATSREENFSFLPPTSHFLFES